MWVLCCDVVGFRMGVLASKTLNFTLNYGFPSISQAREHRKGFLWACLLPNLGPCVGWTFALGFRVG